MKTGKIFISSRLFTSIGRHQELSRHRRLGSLRGQELQTVFIILARGVRKKR